MWGCAYRGSLVEDGEPLDELVQCHHRVAVRVERLEQTLSEHPVQLKQTQKQLFVEALPRASTERTGKRQGASEVKRGL